MNNVIAFFPPLTLPGSLCHSLSPEDTPSQLPAPRNPKIHLYNTEQVLTWEPGAPDWDARPVVYEVQLKYASSEWRNATPSYLPGVNCTGISVRRCNFTGIPEGFSTHFNVSLRVRARLGDELSAWANAPWFQHYRNVTIGPPGDIWVTPRDNSLHVAFSPPFKIDGSLADFHYYAQYWEEKAAPQEEGPFTKTLIELHGLKPSTKYCLQVNAQLQGKVTGLSRRGIASDIICQRTTHDSTGLQQVILVTVATFFSLSGLVGACLFLVLKYRGLVKYWFHSPPNIPSQIEEYLRDPAEPILEALDRDCSPKDDAWDAVSIVSSPEKREDASNAL